MFKSLFVVSMVAVSTLAHAGLERIEYQDNFKEAIKCLELMEKEYPYKWIQGSSPYTFDKNTSDHFVVLGRENAFVRFGSTYPQRCDFRMVHNATRDCVKIYKAQDEPLVSLVLKCKGYTKACDESNPNSITNYTYRPEESTCKNMSYRDMGPILQKQIMVNTQKIIIENEISRKDFDAKFRKSCESIHNKLMGENGTDYGAAVSNAFLTARDNRGAGTDPLNCTSSSSVPSGDGGTSGGSKTGNAEGN